MGAQPVGGDIGAGDRCRRFGGHGCSYGVCSSRASPWPPPPHRAATALVAAPEAIMWAAWTASLAPEAPIGWPREMPPPSGVIRAGSSPRRLAEPVTTAAKA